MVELYKEPRWDSLRATLFGKFYESIVANYFKYVRKFKVYDQGIAVYVDWLDDIERLRKRIEEIRREDIKKLYGIEEKDLEKIQERFERDINDLKKENEKLKKKGKEGRRFNPDLVVEKEGKFYVVEMQVWPVWLKQRHRSAKLTWDIVRDEGVAIIPRILASKVKVQGKVHDVTGFYYVSLSRSQDHEKIERFFKELTKRDFKIWYLEDIVRESKNYDWFKFLLGKVRREVIDLIDKLEQGKVKIA